MTEAIYVSADQGSLTTHDEQPNLGLISGRGERLRRAGRQRQRWNSERGDEGVAMSEHYEQRETRLGEPTLRRVNTDGRAAGSSQRSVLTALSPAPYPTQYPANPLQGQPQAPSYSHDNRALQFSSSDLYAQQQQQPQQPQQPYGHPQRAADSPADPPATASLPPAHENPNLDQRDSEPKRSFRERLGLVGTTSRENLLESEDSSPSTRLRRKASSARRPKDPHNISPQSPPSSGSGRVTPQLGVRRPVNIPEEHEPVTETENLRDLADFFRTTAPSSDPRRRPVSLVGEPRNWSRDKVPGVLKEEDHQPPRSRPRSGSLGDPLERGPPNATAAPTAIIPSVVPKPSLYQAYHPQPGHNIRRQPSLPPLQTQSSSEGAGLHNQAASPLQQQPSLDLQPLSQHPLRPKSPPHFEVQGPDQRRPHDLFEQGAALELSDHLVQQPHLPPPPPVLSPASRSVAASPAQEKGHGMPPGNSSLQLPPRRASPGDGNSEPPTPNNIPPQKMSHAAQVQRAQNASDTGRSTPPPQPINPKDMSEEEINALLQQFKELREKYSKVKRYYFEKDAQVTTLQNALAHQKLSQSRTSLDDGEYMQRLTRLDGLISQLAFGFRKDWKSLPIWLQPHVNKDCITVGKQEMTAVGRAFISKWLCDEVFNRYFHPGLGPEVSRELKSIQNNIRSYGTALQTGEEEDALTAKIINWRLATMDGVQQQLNSAEATTRRQHLIELLDAQLVSSLTEYMTEMPAGLEGGVHMIVELAVTLLMHLPFESRDVVIEYFSPGTTFDERVMRAETTPIAPLGAPMMEPMDSDRISVHSERSDGEGEDEPRGMERQEPRKGFFKDLVSSKKSPPPKNVNAAAQSQNSLLQPPGSSGGPKDEKVRLMYSLNFMLSAPPRSLFEFPPSAEPLTLPPRSNGFTFANPFNIDPELYRAALSPTVPLTFAAVYTTSVFAANQLNRKRKNRPWSISKTSTFKILTVVHNILLALYSAITCAAMVRACYMSFRGPAGPQGIPGSLDSLCKMSGPRGLGDAVTFNPKTNSWASKNSKVMLGIDDQPDTDDVGRLWNEGLAFWGWWFYLSKFYEVLDTMIILLKGKRSATLQTYHHAGAMLCMWAGIRYMSPPIWMFALVNSGIHAFMYTYYTVTELGVKVPRPIKQALTTTQIMQFLVGATFASAHLFVYYSVPVMVPYKVAQAISSAAISASSVASSASAAAAVATNPSVASSIAASATHSAIAIFNKIAALAAGAPGVASNILHSDESLFGLGDTKPLDEIKYATQHTTIHCLDTSGQAFAIWLNCLYLAPLTGLFIRFFVKAYVFGESRPSRSDKGAHTTRRLSATSMSAWAETSRSVEAVGRVLEQSLGPLGVELKDGGEGLTAEEDVKKVLKMLNERSDTNGKDSSAAIDEEEDEESTEDVKEDDAALDGHAPELEARTDSDAGSSNKENESPSAGDEDELGEDDKENERPSSYAAAMKSGAA
ncbi:MAG: hypothetical protein Q9159_002975 [Coniocarpon cinnabarinum]